MMSEAENQTQSTGDDELIEQVIKSVGTLAAALGLLLGIAESGPNRLPGLGVAVCGLLAINAMYLRRILRAIRDRSPK